jgi:peptidoglycan hydrolase FlgJ
MQQLSSINLITNSISKEITSDNAKKASKEIEAFFVHFLLKEMRKTIPDSGFIPKSFAQDIFVDMLDQQIAQNVASKQGFGLANHLEKNINDRQIIIDKYKEGEKTINS